jgi:hypothetical protein
MKILNISAAQNTWHVLDFAASSPSMFITPSTGVIELIASSGSVGVPLPRILLEFDPAVVEFFPANTLRLDTPWSGIHASTIIEINRYGDSGVLSHAPTFIPVSSGQIEFSSGNSQLSVYKIFPPNSLFAGYAADGASLTIPIASLTGLTAAEADAVTGDWREILQAVMLYCVEHHKEFQWSDQPRTYDAFKLDLLNSRYFDRHFLFHFCTDMGAPSIAPEP